MSSDEPKDKTFRKEGGEEKSEEEPVSEDMYVLSDSGDVGKQEVSDKVLAAELNEYGLDLLRSGKFNEAIVAFEKAIEKDPENINLLNNKAQALETLGKYEEALELYEKAVKINSADPDIWNNMAFSFSQVGKYNEAIKAYEKALELRPDYPNALYGKALNLSQAGNFEEAVEAY
ncbi:MAG TPA: tetratricopeptide repeat protein, partial [Methanosarcina sp.]|nr:tetratricopeptide repeat protein [Methanosarcina sp.]